jgi:glutathione S-transferase
MSGLILHHYAMSPFSEKVRLILGLKNLAWQSVDVPVMLPKPDAVALTGGYRRTPFLQVGGDIYCDTALMCQVIEAAAPTPPLYPENLAGLAETLALWADTALFWVAVPYTMQPGNMPAMFGKLPPDYLAAFAADRAAMTKGMKRTSTADAGATLRVYLGRLNNMLSQGHAFLLGDAPTIADFSVYHCLWFMRRGPVTAAFLETFPHIAAWMPRVAAFGQGTPTPLSSQDAIEIAASAASFSPVHVDANAGFAAGASVSVTAADYAQDEVTGTLVGLTDSSVTVERIDERAGKVHVHFPRIGYTVK